MNKGYIDGHVHHYPEEVIVNVGRWAEKVGETYWKGLVLGKGNLQGWASTERLIGDMDEAGIEQVVLQGWYWEHAETCRWQNEFYLKCMREYPGRLVAFAGVQPRAGERAIEDLKWAIDEGVKGIGEVFPNEQGFEMSSKAWLKIVEIAIEAKLPITMHVTEPVGHDYRGRIGSSLEGYVWLAKTYPELKLILAHWGGLLGFYEYNPYIREVLKNVYYDTAASPLLYDSGIYHAMIEAVGVEKVIFGSDYPLRVFPRKQKEPNFWMTVKEVEEIGLKKEDLGKVMGGNLKTLIGI